MPLFDILLVLVPKPQIAWAQNLTYIFISNINTGGQTSSYAHKNVLICISENGDLISKLLKFLRHFHQKYACMCS